MLDLRGYPIQRAYAAAMHRCAGLDEPDFAVAVGCLCGHHDLPLTEALLALAEQGSIEAAATLNALALHDDRGTWAAERALKDIFARNGAATGEAAIWACARQIEEVAGAGRGAGGGRAPPRGPRSNGRMPVGTRSGAAPASRQDAVDRARTAGATPRAWRPASRDRASPTRVWPSEPARARAGPAR